MSDISDLNPLITRLNRLMSNWTGSLTNLQTLASLLTLAGGKWWLTKADLDADLSADAGVPGLVYADADPDNNGIYVKVGAATTGSWSGPFFMFGSTITQAMLDPDVFESFRADVTQVIGRQGDPVDGGAVSDAMYIQAQPVSHPGPLGWLKIWIKDPGDLTIARYIVSDDGTQIKQEQVATVTVSTTGLKTLTPADFGDMPFEVGDLVGVAGDGMFAGSPTLPVDAPGWRQINAALTDWRPLPTLQTSIRLEYGVGIDQHYQVVLGPAFLALQTLAAGLDARATLLEAQAAQQWADVVQTIGNPDTLVTGAGVSDGMYIWADPCAHTGPLLTLDLFAVDIGTVQLAKWSIESDGKLHRNVLIDLAVTATGEVNFTPADFGDIIVAQGEHLGLHGLGILAATSATADGAGWWDVNAYATPRDIPAANVGNRLQARFRIQQQYLATTAEKIFQIDAALAALAAQVATVGQGVKDTLTVASPASLDETIGNHQAPLIGGRIHQRLKRSLGQRTLAHLATVADVNGTITGLSDVTAADALLGATALQLATTGSGSLVAIAPTAADAVPTDVTGGLIRIWFKPIANVFANMDRAALEIYSAGSPVSPGSAYHSTTSGTNFQLLGHLKSQLTSQNGVGRWQSTTIPVSVLVAAPGGGANLSAITWGRLLLRASSGNSFTIQIGNIEFIPNPLPKGKVILSFDDGHVGQFTFAAVRMAKYGFRGMAYLSPPALNIGVSSSYVSRSQAQTMHDLLGWQFPDQAWDTETLGDILDMSENEFTGNLAARRNWDNGMGLTGGEHGSYFSGVGPTILQAYPSFRKHYRSMRAFFAPLGVGAPGVNPMTFGETYPWGDPFQIRALNGAGFTGAENGDKLIAHAQQAATHKGVAQFVWHNEMTSAGNIQNGFLQLLAWLHQNRSLVDVVTEEDLHYGYV
ncbi:hypothetical protein [Caulobacter sp. UNC279MFTsu5.1]|uniref:hypothetical protein n=1 Tax=Caulobacter sp. UNC279MFTsu5.1 TaxID=1502775 RepID=UPI0008EEA7FC|nr:hypothetical protein [Caulobacter sp. UNC279MFTsu5.1]SFK41380.1 hypothetical protein SAMN02799626_04225 [Caulobacter sp. UNC279MFTsu5.1]